MSLLNIFLIFPFNNFNQLKEKKDIDQSSLKLCIGDMFTFYEQ